MSYKCSQCGSVVSCWENKAPMFSGHVNIEKERKQAAEEMRERCAQLLENLALACESQDIMIAAKAIRELEIKT